MWLAPDRTNGAVPLCSISVGLGEIFSGWAGVGEILRLRGEEGLGRALTQQGFDDPVQFVGGEVVDHEFPALTTGVEGHFGAKTLL